ncbi:MAG: FlgD immunoglobulin-like domain containing protein [candidate division FCPU426 bacterium]
MGIKRAGKGLAVYGALGLMAVVCAWGQAGAVEVSGVVPGNGGDSLSTTFHFNSGNVNFQMTKPDGTALTINGMPLAYGTSFQIFNDSQDWVAEKNLQVLGADLSGYSWTSVSFPTPGTVAVDPASGRFKFAAPTWNRMGFIDVAPGGQSDTQMPVVMHADGSAVAAFWQTYESHTRVFANHYIPGLGWQGPVLIDSVANSVPTMHAANPALAMDSQGRVMCVFRQDTFSTNYRMYANLYVPGAGWQGPRLIDSGQDQPTENAAVAMINGKAICVFEQQDGSSNWRVYANEYTVTDGWYGAVTIDAGNAVDNLNPRVAMNSSGQAFCVYARQAATPRVHAVEYVPGAGWQSPAPIDEGTATYIDSFGLAMNNTGRALCLIGTADATPLYSIQAVEYIPGTGWNTPVDLYVNSTGVLGGTLAFNQAGTALAVYTYVGGSNYRLLARQYAVGTGWSSPVYIDSFNPYNTYDERLVLNDQGQGICVFRQNDGSASRIYVNHFANGWSSARILDAGLGFDADMPTVAINSAGEAMSVWRQNDGSKNRLDASCYQVEQPGTTMSVRYHYSPAAAVPAVNTLTVSNRKIEPLKGGQAAIHLAMAQAGSASVKIYSLQGNLVKVLSDGYLAAGNYTWEWAAVNENGARVASGVYLIRVKSPGIDKTQKVVVIK